MEADLTLTYFGIMILVGILFLARFRIKKPKNSTIAIMLAAGALEFILLAIKLVMFKK